MSECNYKDLDTPLGRLRLVSNGEALLRVQFGGRRPAGGHERNDAVLRAAARQLGEYFEGRREAFDLPLAAEGTDFQRRVWRELATIPFGEWRSYGDIAKRVGNKRAGRAVGAANGRNPIPIVVPCHRVVGADRKLTGYAGGLKRKQKLLALEGIGIEGGRLV